MPSSDPSPTRRAVVFDWAGTLVDFGSRAPVIAFVEAFADAGFDVTETEVRAKMGMNKKAHVRAMLQMPTLDRRWGEQIGRPWTEADVDRIYAGLTAGLIDVIPRHCAVIPHAAACIDRLRGAGWAIGSSTGYNAEQTALCVAGASGQGLEVDTVVCADDVAAGRPHPWMIYENMQRLEVYPPSRVVKVDDTAAGVRAGLNAGCWSIGVAVTGNELGLSEADLNALSAAGRRVAVEEARSRLAEAGAHAVVDDLSQLPNAIEALDAGRPTPDGLAPVQPR